MSDGESSAAFGGGRRAFVGGGGRDASKREIFKRDENVFLLRS